MFYVYLFIAVVLSTFLFAAHEVATAKFKKYIEDIKKADKEAK